MTTELSRPLFCNSGFFVAIAPSPSQKLLPRRCAWALLSTAVTIGAGLKIPMSQLFSSEQVIRNRLGRAYCKVLCDGTRLYQCLSCNQWKPLAEMKTTDKDRGYSSECRKCQSLRVRKSRTANHDAILCREQEWRSVNREKIHSAQKRHQGKHRETARRYKQSPRGRAVAVIGSARKRCREKGIQFSLTAEWLETKIAAGKCEVTGLAFDMSMTGRRTINRLAPSIDRIEASQGYVPENCRVVVWMFNRARGKWLDADLLELSEAIVANRDKLKL